MTDEPPDDIIVAVAARVAERAKNEVELAKLKSLKNAYKAKNASKTRLLERVRETIADLVSNIVDEGDRAYFGSTNDADALRDLATEVEGWKWDDILRQSDDDPYATIREQRRRADTAEAELSRLRSENERLQEYHDRLTHQLRFEANSNLDLAKAKEAELAKRRAEDKAWDDQREAMFNAHQRRVSSDLKGVE